MPQQSSREFASTDPTTRIQDAGFQVSGISPKISLSSRSHLQHFQRPTSSHFCKDTPSLSRVLIERGRQIAEELGAPAPDKVKETLMTLLCRVEIRSDRVDITLSRGRLTQLLAESLDLKMQHQAPTSAPDDLLGLTVPVGLKRVGREMRMLVENADAQTPADPSLLRIIARAHHIQARLIQNPKLTVHDIAREEQVSAAYLYPNIRDEKSCDSKKTRFIGNVAPIGCF